MTYATNAGVVIRAFLRHRNAATRDTFFKVDPANADAHVRVLCFARVGIVFVFHEAVG
jgi:hypothetical protein